MRFAACPVSEKAAENAPLCPCRDLSTYEQAGFGESLDDTGMDGELELAAIGCRFARPDAFRRAPRCHARAVDPHHREQRYLGFLCRLEPGCRPVLGRRLRGGGHGKSLAYDEAFIDELRERFNAKALFYFGDLDPAGIRLASRAVAPATTRFKLEIWRWSLPMCSRDQRSTSSVACYPAATVADWGHLRGYT